MGCAAKSLGFRGISIDVEYAEQRYELRHVSWKYSGYTTEDLTREAYRQGEAAIAALLDEFPEAVVTLLPGELHRFRPLGREFMRGVFAEMARRYAPGGLHLASEYTYCLGDPLSTLATSRLEDPLIAKISTTRQAAYWKRRCTVAPGVWPLHMVETGGKDYPLQPWKQELAELREQTALIRAVAKRYVWTFTGNPIWYIHSPEIEAKYGLKKQDLKRDDIHIRDWQKVMSERMPPPAKWNGTIEMIRRFDRGELNPDQFCDAFGAPPTPAERTSPPTFTRRSSAAPWWSWVGTTSSPRAGMIRSSSIPARTPARSKGCSIATSTDSRSYCPSRWRRAATNWLSPAPTITAFGLWTRASRVKMVCRCRACVSVWTRIGSLL